MALAGMAPHHRGIAGQFLIEAESAVSPPHQRMAPAGDEQEARAKRPDTIVTPGMRLLMRKDQHTLLSAVATIEISGHDDPRTPGADERRPDIVTIRTQHRPATIAVASTRALAQQAQITPLGNDRHRKASGDAEQPQGQCHVLPRKGPPGRGDPPTVAAAVVTVSTNGGNGRDKMPAA